MLATTSEGLKDVRSFRRESRSKSWSGGGFGACECVCVCESLPFCKFHDYFLITKSIIKENL